MKKSLIILIFLFTIKTLACDCPDINPAIEFYESDYVFEGKIISKTYAKDSLTYNITFEIYKHYKNGNSPKRLEFNLNSESEYTGLWTSCDWTTNEGENWLVYASKYKGKLTFSGICSNSKQIDSQSISNYEKRILENGNSFDFQEYIYEGNDCFFWDKTSSNIDSIFKFGKIKNYTNSYTILRLFIDKNGKLISATSGRNFSIRNDSIFGFPINFKIVNRKPLTEFEKDAVELIEQVDNWEIIRFRNTQIPVKQLKYLTVEFDKATKSWKYK